MSETPEITAPADIGPGPRQLVVLSGERSWCLRQLTDWLAASREAASVFYVGEPPEALAGRRHAPQSALRQYLGTECDVLVFDALDGFDPDAFGAACGLLVGGGWFFLLTPDVDRWPGAADVQKKNLAVYPRDAGEVGGRYIQRLISVMASDGACRVFRQGDRRLSMDAPPITGIRPPAAGMTPDQCAAVAEIEKTAAGGKPLVLVADRGRGKSAALGFGIAALLARRRLRIIVTAPGKAAVQALFRHAGAYANEVDYCAPDDLIRRNPACDLLLVDEAAAIPASILGRLLMRYPRVVFSTTEHGYEGSGRGFAVRFRRTLDQQAPGWRECRLTTPVRWAENDPLELFCFKALMLDAEPARLAPNVRVHTQALQAEWLDRDELWRDETTLRELFGLLVLAHYETRPTDLRYLLDALNLSVVVMRVCGKVVATALVAREGGLDAGVAAAVVRGERRPQGHLLAQTLGIVCVDEKAPGLRGDRIVRIAVLPELQGRGVGAALLRAIEARASADGCDYAGASFGVDARILRFWRRGGYLAARLGVKRNRASGAHSLAVVKGLNQAGENMMRRANMLFRQQMTYALPDFFSDLEPELAVALTDNNASEDITLGKTEQRILHDFAHHHRAYADSVAALNKLAERSLDGLRPLARKAFEMRVMQRKNWKQTADACGLTGRKQAEALLRQAVAELVGPTR